jgi:hypothetical protein
MRLTKSKPRSKMSRNAEVGLLGKPSELTVMTVMNNPFYLES